VVLEAGIDAEAAVATVDASVGVARVEVVLALGAPEPARLEEERDLPVRDLVPVQPARGPAASTRSRAYDRRRGRGCQRALGSGARLQVIWREVSGMVMAP
jgi:hypothetical protein